VLFKQRVLTFFCLVGLVLNPFAMGRSNSDMKIDCVAFGKTPDGKPVSRFILTNRQGNSVELIDFGAIITTINVPDRDGKRANINAGFPTLDGYFQKHPHFGATVGRFANRIAKGKFSIDGKEYTLATNNGPNHLHGGLIGFDRQMWSASEMKTDSQVGVRFELTSPDGQEGYPGTVKAVAEYLWDNENRLTARFLTTTDKPTHVNITNHAYFNLGGIGSGKIYDHVVQLECDAYVDVDETFIPNGKMPRVEGTPLDFRQPEPLGKRLDQLPATKGYDHCFVIRGPSGTLRKCASAHDPKSGRAMDVETTQPGVQLYTGNHLTSNEASAGLVPRDAFCLETQHFPDTPNQPAFPSTLLKPGETMQETTVFRFYIVK
jgi:aldose 1-epimerase